MMPTHIECSSQRISFDHFRYPRIVGWSDYGTHGKSAVFYSVGYGRDGSFATKPSHASSYQCPLLSNSGQNVAVPRMSAKCQKQTNAPQQIASALDHPLQQVKIK